MDEDKYYIGRVICNNCGMDSKFTLHPSKIAVIPKGISVEEHVKNKKCPECGCWYVLYNKLEK